MGRRAAVPAIPIDLVDNKAILSRRCRIAAINWVDWPVAIPDRMPMSPATICG